MDYRNTPLKFINAGLDVNLPPEGLANFTWRKLDNIRVLTESVMESRPHTKNFFDDSTLFEKKTFSWTASGKTWQAIYPDSYFLGPLVYIGYVGKLKSGEDGFLTIHTPNGQVNYPWENYFPTTSARFSCFLNGIPILEVPVRTGAQLAPLTLSNEIPSVVRILTPNGPTQVIIDGRWKIFPSEVDLANPAQNWDYNSNFGTYYVWAYNATDGVWGQVLATGTPTYPIQPIGAYRVGIGLEPYSTTTTAPPAVSSYTTGSLTGSYNYVQTMRNKVRGTRSIATGSSTTVTLTASGAQVTMYTPLDPQADSYELWRRGGTIGDSWRLVATETDTIEGIGTNSVVVIDSSADVDIALLESLDTTLVKPFPVIDVKGYSCTLLDTNVVVSSLGLVNVVQSGTVVTAAGTSADTTTSPAWDDDVVGYFFSTYNDTVQYLVVDATASTTQTGAQLEVSPAYASATATGTHYMISRSWVRPRCFGPYLGQYAFWVGDPVKKSAFYWNIAGKVDLSTADLSYNTVSDPAEELVNGFIFGGLPFIFSRRKLYALDYLQGAEPEFMPREIPMGIGLAGVNAFHSSKLGVVFLSWDGIYVTDCGGGPPTKLSENLNPIFRGETVADIDAVNWDYASDCRITVTSRDIHFFYRNSSGDMQHLAMEINQQRWSRWVSDNEFSCAYELENTDAHHVVFGSDADSEAYYYSDAVAFTTNETINCKARTGSWDSGIPLTDKEFGVLLLDFDPDGAEITITPRYNSDLEDGTPISTGTAGDTAGRRTTPFSLGDVFKRSLSLEFSWEDTGTYHPKFYQGTLLFREDEEAIKHWYHPPTSLGQDGWFHLKDSYWTLKNSAEVTLTVTVDGVSETYTIPAGGSERVKHYVEFRPMKGKLFSFKLDSTTAFHFYGEDSGLNGKPWKTSTGYQKLNPFTAAGYAQYLRNEGGT